MTADDPSARPIEVHPVELEPTRRGFQLTYNYSIHFWLPTLGPATFATWQALISFCYGDKTTCYPSISLLGDMIANGNRKAITGRWRGAGDLRRREEGALEKLEAAALLHVETAFTGPDTRHTFHVVKEPPLLTPVQLAALPASLRRLHARLLIRSGMHHATYLDLSTYPHAGGAQVTTGEADVTTGGADVTMKHYELRITTEEEWRKVKAELSREINSANYRTYIHPTNAVAFHQEVATLIVQTPDPLTAATLQARFHGLILRTVLRLQLQLDGIPITDVAYRSKP